MRRKRATKFVTSDEMTLCEIYGAILLFRNEPRPSSAVRPVRPWPYHFFGRKWFWPDPFSGRLYISFYFLPDNFSADKILSNNIDNLSVHRSMFCLPRGVKHSRYINMILKLTHSPFYVCADRYVICADLFLRMRGKFTIICAFQLRGF